MAEFYWRIWRNAWMEMRLQHDTTRHGSSVCVCLCACASPPARLGFNMELPWTPGNTRGDATEAKTPNPGVAPILNFRLPFVFVYWGKKLSLADVQNIA